MHERFRCGRIGLAVGAVCGLLVSAAGPLGCVGGEAEDRLVLFITLDTTRADHIGAYGYFRDTSPSIDAFAADAVLFERAVTAMSTTLPAHVSLFTGSYPSTHGVESNFEDSRVGFKASNALRSVAEILSERGWSTAAFVSSAPLKTHTGIQAGFQDFSQPEGKEASAAVTTDEALAWLARRSSGPTLLWLHYFDPHFPWSAPGGPRPLGGQEAQLRFLQRTARPGGALPGILLDNDAYDSEIHYLDEQLGRLFADLKERGLYEEATIVVVGDHGEGLGQHRRRHHGTIHNEQLFVPLIIKLPHSMGRRGERVSDLVSIVDVLPTLAATLDLPLGDLSHLDGVDVLGGPGRSGALAARTTWQREGWDPGRNFAWVTPSWKYIYRMYAPDMLFDLRNDFNEFENVIEEHSEVAERMREVLFAAMAESRAKRATEATSAVIPEGVIEELKALGYGN